MEISLPGYFHLLALLPALPPYALMFFPGAHHVCPIGSLLTSNFIGNTLASEW